MVAFLADPAMATDCLTGGRPTHPRVHDRRMPCGVFPETIQMSHSRQGLLLLGLALFLIGMGSTLHAQVTVARYTFDNNLHSTDSHSQTDASDISVPFGHTMFWSGAGQPPPLFCLLHDWHTTTEQSPANNSQRYMEITIDVDAGLELALTQLRFDAAPYNGGHSVDTFAIYADEEPGSGGDNFNTKLGEVNGVFNGNNWHTVIVDLSGIAILQHVTDAVTLRMYWWDSGAGSSSSSYETMMDNLKIKGLIAPQQAKIGDFVWEDLDHDGRQDNGEPGVPGVTVLLLDQNSNPTGVSTTTDQDGLYEFCVDAGTYRVQWILPPGYAFTVPDNAPGDLDSDANPVTGITTHQITIDWGQTNYKNDAGLWACTGPQAFVVDLGPSCGLPEEPVITATPPVLGQTMTLSMTSIFPNSLLIPFYSFGPVTPCTFNPPGCTVYVDFWNLPNMFYLGLFYSDAGGNWDINIPLPEVPALAGLEVVFQVRVCSPTGPPGPLSPDWPSNGLSVHLGCP